VWITGKHKFTFTIKLIENKGEFMRFLINLPALLQDSTY